MQGGFVSCRKPISGKCQPGCVRVSAKKCAPRPKYEAFRLQGGDEDSIEFHRRYLKAGMDEDPSNRNIEQTRKSKLTKNTLLPRQLEKDHEFERELALSNEHK